MYHITRTDLETGERIEFRTVYPTRDEVESATLIISRDSYKNGCKTEHTVTDDAGRLVARFAAGQCIVRVEPDNALSRPI